MKNKILVAVSGGPDSMYLLYKLSKSLKYSPIVLHVNYNFRKESLDDQKVVEDYCSKNDLELYVLNVSDKEHEKFKSFKNKQALAREIRFNFFLEKSKELNINKLYIGHNKDDFLETAIMQDERSKMFLYYGIKKRSSYKSLKIIRPLISLWKEDIIKKCKRANIPFIIDLSNFEKKYLRNKIRLNLKTYSLKDKTEIFKHFMSINNSQEKFRKKINNLYLKWETVEFSLSFYNERNHKLKKQLLYQYITHNEERINVSDAKLEGMINFLNTTSNNKQYRLMENLFLTISNGSLNIVKK